MTEPPRRQPATPAVFIHGLWLHATSWGPGSSCSARPATSRSRPGWPHEPDTVAEAREQPELVANTGIDEATDALRDDHRRARRARRSIIGHSFGGLITEKLLGQGIGAAGVAIDPAQIKGVLPLPLAQLRAGLPGARQPGQPAQGRLADREGVPLRLRQRADARRSPTRSTTQWTIPSPARPLFQAAAANFALHSEAKVDTGNETRGPLLLISGTEDHTVPDVVTRSTLKQYRDSTAVTELQPVRGPRPLADRSTAAGGTSPTPCSTGCTTQGL